MDNKDKRIEALERSIIVHELIIVAIIVITYVMQRLAAAEFANTIELIKQSQM